MQRCGTAPRPARDPAQGRRRGVQEDPPIDIAFRETCMRPTQIAMIALGTILLSSASAQASFTLIDVPEPASLLLLGAPALALTARHLLRRGTTGLDNASAGRTDPDSP